MNIYQITAKLAREKYLKLKSRLEKSISSGRFDTLSRRKKDALIYNVEKHRLKLDKFGLKGVLAAGSILAASAVSAQTDPLFFKKSGVNAFSGNSNQGEAANLDADSDLEIILSTSSGGYILDGNYSSGFSNSYQSGLTGMTSDFVVGDFDGDDISDIAFYDGSTIRLALNDGYGNFPSSSYLASTSISDMVVADIDSDGDNDVVWTTGNSTSLYVVKNGGSGSFSSATTIPTGASDDIDQIVIADIDDDGDKDLIVSEFYQYYYAYVYSPGGGYGPYGPYDYDKLKVIINTLDSQGDPVFDSKYGIELELVNGRYFDFEEIAVADVDGDETLDIVTSHSYDGYSEIRLFRGASSGQNNFTASQEDSFQMDYDYSLRDLELSDVDVDGDLDILVSLNSRIPALLRVEDNQFSYYLLDQYNGNNGAFGDFSTYGIDMVLGDFDGDDQDDIVVAGTYSSRIYLNNFAPPSPKFVGNAVVAENSPAGTKVGFIEAFGQDITVTLGGDDAGLFSFNASTFELTTASQLDWETLGSTLNISFDITLDGSTTTVDQVVTIVNQAEAGKGTLNESFVQLFGDKGVAKFAVADVDNDGDDDFVVSNLNFGGGPGVIEIDPLDSYFANILYKQVSDGVFVPQPIYDLSRYTASAFEFNDVDGDGDVDLIAIVRGGECCGGEEMRILENIGGEFTSDTSLSAPYNSFSNNERLISGDFDGDGIDDAVLVRSGNAYAFEGTGLGLAASSISLPDNGTSGVRDAVVGDIDGDGFEDVVLLAYAGESGIIYGADDFFDSSIASVGAFYSSGADSSGNLSIAISDLDEDGDLDAIVAREDGIYSYMRGSGGFGAGVLILNTENTYSSGGSYGEYGAAFALAIADMDGDGDQDLVSVDYSKYIIFETEDVTHSLRMKLHLNDGDGNFTLAQDFETGGAAMPFAPSSYSKYTLDLIDVDGDDDLDVVVNNNASEFLYAFSSKYNFEADFPTGLMVFKNDNVAPSGISLDETSFDENLEIASQVATVSVEDLNLNDTHTLFMTAGDGENDVDNSKFVIDGDRLLILESPDFESQAEYRINVKAIDDEGASVAQAFTLTVNDVEPEVTGIGDEDLIRLYPNPGKNVINLRIDNNIQGDMQIRVSDLSGRTIHEIVDSKGNGKWSRSISMINQEPGIYIVEIEVGGKTLKQRWIKQD
ncbi:MAG: FG-GAP-like repeat-containing protein [Ekhidna sp.]|uniref:FG-GAP-like repeat-containing protein n=1 Tax=Ekhidna sp. TaxID=2608089 RepID=UPI0032EEF311